MYLLTIPVWPNTSPLYLRLLHLADPTAKSLRQGPQEACPTSIQFLISQVSKCATFAGCKQQGDWGLAKWQRNGGKGDAEDFALVPDDIDDLPF